MSELFERLIVKNLIQYLDLMELFSKNQHGFHAGRSCLSQLLEHQIKILSYLEEGKEGDGVYPDFTKNFDKIDNGVPLRKWKSIGITNCLLKLIISFLTGRKQECP